MKTLEDLNKLRDKLQAEMNIRDKNHDITVNVSMGTCGIAAGARDTMKALIEEISRQNIKDIALTQTGCVGSCQQEPLVEIKKGLDKVIYVNVDPEKAKEIVCRHLVEGKVIEQWTILEK